MADPSRTFRNRRDRAAESPEPSLAVTPWPSHAERQALFAAFAVRALRSRAHERSHTGPWLRAARDEVLDGRDIDRDDGRGPT